MDKKDFKRLKVGEAYYSLDFITKTFERRVVALNDRELNLILNTENSYTDYDSDTLEANEDLGIVWISDKNKIIEVLFG